MCLSNSNSHSDHTSAYKRSMTDDGQPLRFTIELDSAAACVRVLDYISGDVLTEFDERTSQKLLAESDDKSTNAAIALSEAVLNVVQPRATPTSLTHSLTQQMLEEQVQSDQSKPRKTRRKLWELAHKLHCPVIGTCLDTNELRQIARKAGAKYNGVLTDYDVHLSFVSAADDKNSLSLAAHKALDKKYASQIKRFSRAKSLEQLTKSWEEGLARGEAPSALWATLTHPACDDALKARTFEEIHMLSHQIGAGQRADLKRLREAEAELQTLQRDFDAAQKRHWRQLEEREHRITMLERELNETRQQCRELLAAESQLHHEITELRAHNSQRHLDELSADLADREHQLAVLRHRTEALEPALTAAEQEAAQLQNDNAELVAECTAMERFITQSLDVCDACEKPGYEGNPDLGGRRILCVGGRSRLIDHYRELVTRCNGRFEHYDGGIEDNRQRLDALLSSADAVVCATDNVSHDAYYRLKRYCKRSETPHIFLRSSGISSFTRALYGMTGLIA